MGFETCPKHIDGQARFVSEEALARVSMKDLLALWKRLES